jgi:GntR family transcriptional regulator
MPERPSLSGRIAADLRESILSGELPPGSLLPSERELISRYKTTKSTASKAVALLQAEGLVTTEFGRGTFVRNQPPLRRVSSTHRHAAHRSSGKPIFDTEAVAQGQVPSRQILHVGRTPVPADVGRLLQIPPGQEAVVRRRLQSLDGQPAVISASYYPVWLAEGTRLESPEALPEGPDALIETLGHRFSYGIELFRARMPTHEESRLLGLGPGVPVVRMLHVDYDKAGRTLQVADDLYAGDRHEFAFEWTEPEGDETP